MIENRDSSIEGFFSHAYRKIEPVFDRETTLRAIQASNMAYTMESMIPKGFIQLVILGKSGEIRTPEVEEKKSEEECKVCGTELIKDPCLGFPHCQEFA